MTPPKTLPALPFAAIPPGDSLPAAAPELRLPWPDRKRHCPEIIPVFLPFAGCPMRCVFCAQDVQSGAGALSPQKALHFLQSRLAERQAQKRPAAELGFFGGTFTALPAEVRTACLKATRHALENGTACAARCSTRPDAVDAAVLEELKNAGFTTVELGVQSFDAAALAASRRGYGPEAAHAACALVREAGLTLGVQLLPGMPGVTPEIFLQDVRAALDAGAGLLRFYPCQVIDGTELARLWRAGAYAPWSLEETLPALAQGWLAARAAGAAVIRMGLAPEGTLDARRLAGPEHPALGALVQADALLLAVAKAAAGRPLAALAAPRRCQGFFWGERGSLGPRWQALGISPAAVRWHTLPEIHLCLA